MGAALRCRELGRCWAELDDEEVQNVLGRLHSDVVTESALETVTADTRQATSIDASMVACSAMCATVFPCVIDDTADQVEDLAVELTHVIVATDCTFDGVIVGTHQTASADTSVASGSAADTTVCSGGDEDTAGQVAGLSIATAITRNRRC